LIHDFLALGLKVSDSRVCLLKKVEAEPNIFALKSWGYSTFHEIRARVEKSTFFGGESGFPRGRGEKPLKSNPTIKDQAK
jgi:hypothetical protein